MRNYLIIVEGAHDIALLEKLLRLNDVDKKIHNEKDLPEVWKHTIPARYPFNSDRLDRITPIPSFVKNAEISVAIKNANSDTEIMSVLRQTLHLMEIKELDQISGIMLICDADDLTADKKRHKLLASVEEKEDFILDEKTMELDVQIKKIPLYTFVFPDDSSKGNLENLLLQTAEVEYPELLRLATEYVEKASDICTDLRKEQKAKKATVGCIANAMKPGKANQVSIADDKWVSQKTITECSMLKMLDKAVKEMISK